MQLIKERGCHEGRDEEFDTLVLDEDRFLDELEDLMQEGGKVCLEYMYMCSYVGGLPRNAV
jgi:broad-specificity NMP kinase